VGCSRRGKWRRQWQSLWERKLQTLVDEFQLRDSACYLPAGTRKWNQIDYRLFAYISRSSHDKPLVNHEVIVNLIVVTVAPCRTASGVALGKSGFPGGTLYDFFGRVLPYVNPHRPDTSGPSKTKNRLAKRRKRPQPLCPTRSRFRSYSVNIYVLLLAKRFLMPCFKPALCKF